MSLALGQPQGGTGASLGCSGARDIFGVSPALARRDYLLLPLSLLFSRARIKGFSFFPVGRPFSLRERVDLRSQKEGILGRKIAWEGWVEKKDAQKKVGYRFSVSIIVNPRLPQWPKISRNLFQSSGN